MSVQERASAEPLSRVIQGIERVDLRVVDLARSISFYRDIGGLQVLSRDDGRAVMGPADGRGFLGLDSAGVTERADPRSTGLFHVAILYPDRRALGEALARLTEAQIAVGAGDHLVSEALYIDDPDGNGVELYRDRPREQWPEPAPGDLVAMATEAVDLQGVLDEALAHGEVRRDAPAETIVGHVHLQVADVDEAVAFYRDVVGLDLMTKMGSQAAFLASNGYHHHLGANAWRSRAGRPARPNAAGLSGITFAVPHDELSALRDRLERSGSDPVDEGPALVVRDPHEVTIRFVGRA
jgi:catechol 2,3-dioxygenase